ncbi:MAG TPA: hypothetical protein VFZ66_13230 [Herpetosiphonaceae bacterium]
MKRLSASQALGGAALVGGAVLSGYLLARPRLHRWGATDEEVSRVMPGDDLIADPSLSLTVAITIDAPADAIWPWLVQLGKGRGGWYSYAWLENLMGLDIQNTDRILPEFQRLQPGDVIPTGGPDIPVLAVEPSRLLLLGGADYATIAIGLYPLDEGHTRLVYRNRARLPLTPGGVFWRLVLDPGILIMSRKMLLTIKERVERAAVRTAAQPESRPSPLLRLINRGVAKLATAGLTPPDTVALHVPGRLSGKLRSVAVTLAEHEGEWYVVSLGGETDWVRNVRAAGGSATLCHGMQRQVRLEEVPVAERAPMLQAYLGKRALTKSPERVARTYFGLGPHPSIEALETIADRYPVFKLVSGGTLIDQYLPRFDVADVFQIVVAAAPEETYAALRSLDLMEVAQHSAIVQTLSTIRLLPERILARFHHAEAPAAPQPTYRIADLGAEGEWVRIDEREGAEFVFGAIGRFWKSDAGFERIAAADFADFARPGYAKVAVGFTVQPYGIGGTLLTAEMRTATTDAAARRRFLRYWRVVGPGASFIMRQIVEVIKANAERRHIGHVEEIDDQQLEQALGA